jgi:hypothetical protein
MLPGLLQFKYELMPAIDALVSVFQHVILDIEPCWLITFTEVLKAL